MYKTVQTEQNIEVKLKNTHTNYENGRRLFVYLRDFASILEINYSTST